MDNIEYVKELNILLTAGAVNKKEFIDFLLSLEGN